MVLETDPLPLGQWLSEALPIWLAVMGALAFGWLLLGFLISTLKNGPGKAGDNIFKLLVGAATDLVKISPRRVYALARLAVQESVRRRVLAGLGVYLVILAFAVWFLDPKSHDPATLYLSFVLTATTYLILLMALFLSAFSLPADIKSHTIYTIVTKPVRPSEIVLGRILGFAFIGTVVLAIMGLFSYVFVVRGLSHTHQVSLNDLKMVKVSGPDGAASEGTELSGFTAPEHGHRHEVVISPDGASRTDIVDGHWHEVTSSGEGADRRLTVGPPQGQFHSRVPSYGRLSFKDRQGQPTTKGINVGNEWTYRSYIEGGTRGSATWEFEGLNPQDFPDGLPMNLTIRVFRSHKGDIEKTVHGSYVLRNPSTGVTSEAANFNAKEFSIAEEVVPLKLKDSAGRSIELFRDLVDANGNLEVELVCLAPGQYFGMARPDLYLLPRETSFAGNFLKGYVSIWLQMLLITAFGVMWSTFLNGSVAMLATLSTLVMGFCVLWIRQLGRGEVIGGGPTEAAFRLVNQKSISVDLDESLPVMVMHGIDGMIGWVLLAASNLAPNFSEIAGTTYDPRAFNIPMGNATFVADGFDIPPELLLQQMIATAGFLVPIFLIGFLCLKMREVAQ